MPFLVRKALVADDNERFRALVRAVLDSLGVEDIIEAANGHDAIEALKTFDAGLVVLDWMMPGMDGIECTRRIRSTHHHNPCVPIVMVSARDSGSDIQAAIEAGVTAYIPKPTSAMRLFGGFLAAVAEQAA